MSSDSFLGYIQQCFTRYGIITYMSFGNIGLLFNIAIFSQPTHRRNPGSLYLLAMSVCSLIGLNIGVIPAIYSLNQPNPTGYSLLFCQLQYYVRHAFNQMMRSFFVLACADRYTLSDNQARIRSFSQYRVAVRVIPSVIIFWLFLSIYPALLYTLVDNACTIKSGLSTYIYSIYTAIVVGIIPLVCMVTFSILLNINLKKMRGRVQPMTNTNAPVNQHLRRRDRDMLRMLIIEVMCFTSTTGPLVVMLIYRPATQTTVKSNERLQIESFLGYLTSVFLLFMNNSISFWIYIWASRSFRLEFKNLIIKCYKLITCQQLRMNEIN